MSAAAGSRWSGTAGITLGTTAPDRQARRQGRPGREIPARAQGDGPMATRPRTDGEIVRLKVTLRGIRSPIWRRLLVPSAMPLRSLHDAIQGPNRRSPAISTRFVSRDNATVRRRFAAALLVMPRWWRSWPIHRTPNMLTIRKNSAMNSILGNFPGTRSMSFWRLDLRSKADRHDPRFMGGPVEG